MKNEMTMKILAMSKNEQFIRSAVASFCVELEPTIEEINDVKTAVSEAVTNCIVHGYEGESGEIELNVKLVDNVAEITISDEGRGILDIEEAMKPFFTTKPEQERSGMGFTVMQTFMDDLKVEHNVPSGLIVKMTKCFGKQ